ncbi:MAG: tRNA 5-methylaminomethyl-2-thiouridine biosynthesis bifunctional protein [Myxococcota bacterium]|jgi:tRNA 5-methylaminomethyl-2-thiouridine biosynthesis bifunctional protein
MSIHWEGERLIHAGFSEGYFSPAGGLGESKHVFLGGNRLAQRFAALRPGDRFTIGEAGFGTGRNFLATWALFSETAPPGAALDYHTFESWPLPFDDAARAIATFPELAARLRPLRASWPLPIPGCAPVWTGDSAIRLRVWVGDILDGLAEAGFTADAWFLDGFSPAKNPAMWSPAVLAAVARRSRPGSTLATYTAAGDVRRGLRDVGFAPRRESGYGGKLHMLAAERTDAPAPPLPRQRGPRYPTPPLRPLRRVAVIGAGIAGSSAARALAEAGASVTVIDADGIASGASGNPLGLIQPLPNLGGSPVGDWYSRAFVWTRALAARLSLPWDVVGVTRHTNSDKKRRYAERLLDKLSWQGVLSQPTGDGILDIAHAAIIPPIIWCTQLLAHPDITLRAPLTVTGLRADGPLWSLETPAGLLSGFDVVVLANSAAARDLSSGLPLRWVRGQLGWVDASEASSRQQRTLCHDGYLLPARDGTHLLGATYHAEDTDLSWREEDWQLILSQLRDNIPGAADALGARVGGRVALRGVTPGRLPFVGPAIVPEVIHRAWQKHSGGQRPWFGPEGLRPGLWCTVGHGSRGLSSGPFAAGVLAEQLAGRSPPLPRTLAEQIHPARARISIEKREYHHRDPS